MNHKSKIQIGLNSISFSRSRVRILNFFGTEPVLIVVLVFLCVGLGCSTTQVDFVEASGSGSETRASLTEEQKQLAEEVQEEVAIGRALAAKLLGTYGSYDRDRKLVKYLNLVGNNLALQIGRPELNFYFGIMDTAEVNAFALPGGYILITRGLLKKIKSESELAGVLAHEIAHINQKHMYKDIKPKRSVGGTESLVRILSRGRSDVSGSLTAAINRGLAMLLDTGISHNLEYEADEVGAVYISQTGYNPNDLVQVLERLGKEPHDGMMSKTHPPFPERIAKLNKVIANYNLPLVLKAQENILINRFNGVLFKEKQ